MTTRYQSLDCSAIQATAERLEARIEARFPGRGLLRVTGEVRNAIRLAEHDTVMLATRERGRRWLSYGLIVVFVGALVLGLAAVFDDALSDAGELRAFDWLMVSESAVNDIVFIAVAVYFLWTMERRRKRTRALASLHRLRSLAHVIDMHQLTKDPDRLQAALPPTPASAHVDLSAAELGRYLDYCSELLSLVGKAAALYAQASSEPVVLDTVSEIESLTVGLSGKIWQKIGLLQRQR